MNESPVDLQATSGPGPASGDAPPHARLTRAISALLVADGTALLDAGKPGEAVAEFDEATFD